MECEVTTMQLSIVESTALTGIAYAAAIQRLEVEFRDRSLYQYSGVSAEVHAAFLRSPSKGKFFNRSIRGCFPHVLVSAAAGSKSTATDGDSLS